MVTDSPTSELPVFDKTDGRGTHDVVSIVTPSNQLEPIVTRRELWSYYRTRFLLPLSGSSNGSFLVYLNGIIVRLALFFSALN